MSTSEGFPLGPVEITVATSNRIDSHKHIQLTLKPAGFPRLIRLQPSDEACSAPDISGIADRMESLLHVGLKTNGFSAPRGEEMIQRQPANNGRVVFLVNGEKESLTDCTSLHNTVADLIQITRERLGDLPASMDWQDKREKLEEVMDGMLQGKKVMRHIPPGYKPSHGQDRPDEGADIKSFERDQNNRLEF